MLPELVLKEEDLLLEIAKIYDKNLSTGKISKGDVTATVFLAICNLLKNGKAGQIIRND